MARVSANLIYIHTLSHEPDLNTVLFSTASPEHDVTLQQALVQPTVLAALLNAESTLLAAPKGYGKDTFGLDRGTADATGVAQCLSA